MPGMNILESDRICLREFTEQDVHVFWRLGSDPKIIRFTHDPPLADLDAALALMRSHPLADYRKHGFGRWACVLKKNQAVIGFVGLKRLVDLGEVDIGYRLLPEYWGQGLATEAAKLAMEYGFQTLQLNRIIALVDPSNHPSVRVLEKLGMRRRDTIDYFGSFVAKYVRFRNGP